MKRYSEKLDRYIPYLQSHTKAYFNARHKAGLVYPHINDASPLGRITENHLWLAKYHLFMYNFDVLHIEDWESQCNTVSTAPDINHYWWTTITYNNPFSTSLTD